MNKKSPIYVGQIQFYTYNQDQVDELALINQFPFDDRSDFIAEPSLAGIAVKIAATNERFDSGVRRNVSLTLVDVTSRCEVASQSLKIILRRQECFKDYYAHFPADGIIPGHTFKLIIDDPIASHTIDQRVFRLIDANPLPHPAEWYGVCDGGIRPAWESNLYKSIGTEDGQSYYVRFNIEQKLGYRLPSVLPELELRLYVPDEELPLVMFAEPRCTNSDDFKDNIWCVEYPFTTAYDRNGVFYAELLCMEYPIAGFVFATDEETESGKWFGTDIEPLDEYSANAVMDRWIAIRHPESHSPQAETMDFDKLLDDFINVQKEKAGSDSEIDESDRDSENELEHDESLLSALDHLTGLRSVKEKLTVYERVVRFNKMRSERGLPSTTSPLHAMFLGSPGTGKTTVAKMMGIMLHRAGMLSKGHVVVRERATLLGQNYNSEAEKTIEAIEKAQGGILFIDEAYQLYQPSDPRDPGKFVIETLLTALADDSNCDWMLVLAGYSDQMKRMFDMNPGFKSRIPDSNIYVFDDFTESELMEIAEKYLKRNNYTLSDDARLALTARLNTDYARRDKTFGNARHVINMIQTEILPSMAVRVITAGLDDDISLTEIQASDIPAPTPLGLLPSARPRIGFVA
jgi:hypothetical protein